MDNLPKIASSRSHNQDALAAAIALYAQNGDHVSLMSAFDRYAAAPVSTKAPGRAEARVPGAVPPCPVVPQKAAASGALQMPGVPAAVAPATAPLLQADAAIDLEGLCAWQALAGVDAYPVTLCYKQHRQRIFVNDSVEMPAIRWLFSVMTGLCPSRQTVKASSARLPRDGAGTFTMTVSGKPTYIDVQDLRAALRCYAQDMSPARLIDRVVKLLPCGAHHSLQDVLDAMPEVWCDRDNASFDSLLPLAQAFVAEPTPMQAYLRLSAMHPDVRWLAPVVLGAYHADLSAAAPQYFHLMGVVADAGKVADDETVACAQARLDLLHATLASIAAGAQGLGGETMINRLVTPESARHIEGWVERLLMPPDQESLPVGLLLGHTSDAVACMHEILDVLRQAVPGVLGDHPTGSKKKKPHQDIFSGAKTVSGARLVYAGLMGQPKIYLDNFLQTLRTPEVQARLRHLNNSLMAAYAVSQPRRLLRNLAICEAPDKAHYWRPDLPPREPEIDRKGRRRADDVNKGVVLRWLRAGIETLLNNPRNTRRMAAEWSDFKAYVTSDACDADLRLKMQHLIAASHVSGDDVNASVQLWIRADTSTLPFTHVMGAAWACAKRHKRQGALLENLASKVDLNPLHVWCHNGLSEEICHALAGYEKKLTLLVYEAPLPLANTLTQRYHGWKQNFLNGPELMAVRQLLWTDAERRYIAPSGDVQRDDFEDYIDAYEQFLNLLRDMF